jgi:hypothetical protein
MLDLDFVLYKPSVVRDLLPRRNRTELKDSCPSVGRRGRHGHGAVRFGRYEPRRAMASSQIDNKDMVFFKETGENLSVV